MLLKLWWYIFFKTLRIHHPFRMWLKQKQNIRRQRKYSMDLTFSGAVSTFKNLKDLHKYFHHYFFYFAPAVIREHRRYHVETQKGLGDNAFHAMWWLLFKEFKPVHCLEIGVYRGQVISLWALISKVLNIDVRVTGISPFGPVEGVTNAYQEVVNCYQDTLDTFDKFGLRTPQLVVALSQDYKSKEVIKSKKWDVIYIDGNHEYEAVKEDYLFCRDYLSDKGFIVFDDSSMYMGYKKFGFSFVGWEGPSRVVKEIALKEMEHVATISHINIFRKKQPLIN